MSEFHQAAYDTLKQLISAYAHNGIVSLYVPATITDIYKQNHNVFSNLNQSHTSLNHLGFSSTPITQLIVSGAAYQMDSIVWSLQNVIILRPHLCNINQIIYEREILPHIVNGSYSFEYVVNNNRNLTARLSYPTQHPQHGTSGFSGAHNPPDSQYEQNIQQATQQSRTTAYQHGDMPGTSNFLHSAQAGSSGLQQAGQSGGPVGGRPSSTSQRFAPYHQPTPQSSHSTLRSLLENPSPPSTSTRQRSLSPRSPVYTPVPENLLRPQGPEPATRPRTPAPLTPPQFSWSSETDQALEDAIAVMRDSPRGKDGQS
ncbi:hypothetical protein L7G72_19950 [Xenorhabdus bovienii]|uniref:hypothetical protein n=1 Tax=Xenorhabdus bovienii TaxID=40576 RepID=UPI001EDE634D|nr:hypothetical protein [Xenorhabdus bovienii]MCG3464032.1 hypothetical protein [Xenorhabdus bovienii]